MSKESFGEVIRKARKAEGISLREMASRIGISHPYLSQLENGHNDNPSIEIVLKISKELDISFAYLISISGVDIGLDKGITDEFIDIFEKMKPSDFFEGWDNYEEFKKVYIEKGHINFHESDDEEFVKSREEVIKNLYNHLTTLKKIEQGAIVNAKLRDSLQTISNEIYSDDSNERMNVIKDIPKINRRAFNEGLPIPVYVDENNNVNIQIIKGKGFYLSQDDTKELNSMIKGFLYSKKFKNIDD